jgi:hypothetical protein
MRCGGRTEHPGLPPWFSSSVFCGTGTTLNRSRFEVQEHRNQCSFTKMSDGSPPKCQYCGATVPPMRSKVHQALCSAYASGDLSLLAAIPRRAREVEVRRRGRAMMKGKTWQTRPAKVEDKKVCNIEDPHHPQTRFENGLLSAGRAGSSRNH